MSVKNIVFDVGGVLLKQNMEEYMRAHIKSVENLKGILGAFGNTVERVQLDRGTITTAEMIERCLRRVPENCREEAKALFEGYSTHRVAIEGMVELLEKLKKEGRGLYVLSNFSMDFQQVIDNNRLEFFKLFDGVFVSSLYGTVKPEREIYQTFLKKYGLPAEECLFIDDRAENVEAAMYAGMYGFHFHGDASELARYIEQIAE